LLVDDEPAPFLRQLKTWPGNVDRWNIYDVVLPGVLLMDSGSAPPDGRLRRETRRRSSVSSVSGLDAGNGKTRPHYFFQQFAWIRARRSPASPTKLTQSVLAGFEEDRDIILAQQRILDLGSDSPMLAMRMDVALASFRSMLEKAIAEERAGA